MSLDNIRGVLAVVHRLLQANDGRAVGFGDDEVAGLTCILDNAFHALRFEQYYRERDGD
jgi:hypothetical protein